MKLARVAAVLIIGLWTVTTSAQFLSEAHPESVGLSSDQLERLSSVIEREIEVGNLPGAVVGVARRGKLAYFEALGYQDWAERIPMREDAIFSIASMTKPIFAVAAMTLYEQGLLLLDEPVGSYLPELADRVVAIDDSGTKTEPALRQPTIQDLMRHTSGFVTGAQGSDALHARYPRSLVRQALTEDEFIGALSKLPLRYQPRTTYEYGPGFDILGIIIERITKKSIFEFLFDEIFEPLGMVDTSFQIPADKAARQARPLPKDPISGADQEARDHSTARGIDCGSGCLVSTARDYLVFAQMLLNGGVFDGNRVLGPKTVEHMTSDQMGSDIDLSRLYASYISQAYGHGYGLGVAVRRSPGLGSTIGSRGDFKWAGAAGTAFWVDPEEELVIVFMSQAGGQIRGYYRQLIPSLIYPALLD